VEVFCRQHRHRCAQPSRIRQAWLSPDVRVEPHFVPGTSGRALGFNCWQPSAQCGVCRQSRGQLHLSVDDLAAHRLQPDIGGITPLSARFRPNEGFRLHPELGNIGIEVEKQQRIALEQALIR
jgi:hypothetical protein